MVCTSCNIGTGCTYLCLRLFVWPSGSICGCDRGDRWRLVAWEANSVGTAPCLRPPLWTSWQKQSSVKCSEHSLENLDGLQSPHSMFCTHTWRSSGSLSGNLWQYNEIRQSRHQDNTFFFYWFSIKNIFVHFWYCVCLFRFRNVCARKTASLGLSNGYLIVPPISK